MTEAVAREAWMSGRAALAGEIRAACVRLYARDLPAVPSLEFVDSLLEVCGETGAAVASGRVAALVAGWRDIAQRDPYASLFFGDAAVALSEALGGQPAGRSGGGR